MKFRKKTTIRPSSGSNLPWNDHFYKTLSYFRNPAVFEANNEDDISSIGNKTTNIYKQNPVVNGIYKVSEVNDVLQSGYYESPLAYKNVVWFVNEVITLEKQWLSFLKTLRTISL